MALTLAQAAAPVAVGDAFSLLDHIGKRFNELRQGGRAPAWLELQRLIMDNLAVLCPAAISLKEAVQLIQEIEEFLKGSSERPGASPTDLIREFLGGGTVEGQPLLDIPPAAGVEQQAETAPAASQQG